MYENYDWVDKKRRCKVNFSLLSAQQSLSNFSLIFPTFVFVFVFVIVFVWLGWQGTKRDSKWIIPFHRLNKVSPGFLFDLWRLLQDGGRREIPHNSRLFSKKNQNHIPHLWKINCCIDAMNISKSCYCFLFYYNML